MKPTGLIASAAVLVAASLAAGYWWGADRPATGAPAATAGAAASGEVASVPAAAAKRRILYYRNPMGLPDTSPVPKKDPMGMDYLPVYADEEMQDEPPGTVRIAPGR